MDISSPILNKMVETIPPRMVGNYTDGIGWELNRWLHFIMLFQSMDQFVCRYSIKITIHVEMEAISVLI